MRAQELKNSILHLAVQGKLVEQREEEGHAEELYHKVQRERKKLIKIGKIRINKTFNEIKDENTYDIPKNWVWTNLEFVSYSIGNKNNQVKQKHILNKGKYPVVSQSLKKVEGYSNDKSKLLSIECPAVIVFGDHSKTIKLIDFDFVIGADGTKIMVPIEVNPKYLFYVLNYNRINMTDRGYSRHYQFLKEKPIPLPPFEEQKRIVEKIEELMPYVDQYDKAYTEVEELNKKFPDEMQKSILQYAIQGKLVEHREEEGTAEELYQQIQGEKKKLIEEGKIKKTKPLPEITEDEVPFDIPISWMWIRLGNAMEIARGGSPRPIKSYLTNSNEGINWIKIGDTDKGKKYISSTKEKIIKEGMKKSRYVKKGDFLLSNSMSFGKPYILDIDGCIHDGWLVLSQKKIIFDTNFLYYLLSSNMVFAQFTNIVSGAVVNNLNSNKVKQTIVPLPPLEEQKRIVEKIEQILPYIDKLKQ